jgi:IS605 OrfB family transposase
MRRFTRILQKASSFVLGDLKGIRNGARHGKVPNQKIHQWMFRRVARRIEEKAEFVGGVRYTPHLCCPIEWNIHPVGKTA